MATIKDTEKQVVNLFNNKTYIKAAHKAALYALDNYIAKNTGGMPIGIVHLASKNVPEDENPKCLADILAPAPSLLKWINGRQPLKIDLNLQEVKAFDDCFSNSAVVNETIADGEYTLSIKTNRPHDDKTDKDTKVSKIETDGIKLLADIYLTNFICGAQKDYTKFKKIRKNLFFSIVNVEPVQKGIFQRTAKISGGFQDWKITYKITLNNKSALDALNSLAIKKCGIDTSKYQIKPGKAFNNGFKLKDTYILTIKRINTDEIKNTDLEKEMEELKPIIAKYFKTFIMPLESDIITDVDNIFDTVGEDLAADCMYAVADEKNTKRNIYLRYIVESNFNTNKNCEALINSSSSKKAKMIIENIVANKIKEKFIKILNN